MANPHSPMVVGHGSTLSPTDFDATQGILQGAVLQSLALAKRRDAERRLFGPGNRNAVRPKSSEEVGVRVAEARVEVRPGVDDRGGRNEVCIEVAVYSMMKPGAFKRVRVSRYAPTAEVQIAAGACAEDCAEQFGDPFDPAQAAADAAKALAKLRG